MTRSGKDHHPDEFDAELYRGARCRRGARQGEQASHAAHGLVQ